MLAATIKFKCKSVSFNRKLIHRAFDFCRGLVSKWNLVFSSLRINLFHMRFMSVSARMQNELSTKIVNEIARP